MKTYCDPCSDLSKYLQQSGAQRRGEIIFIAEVECGSARGLAVMYQTFGLVRNNSNIPVAIQPRLKLPTQAGCGYQRPQTD